VTALTHRERFLRTMHFEPVDHVPDEEFGYWDNTLTLWHEQGLPREIDNLWKADVYFGFAPRGWVGVHQGLLPGFERQVLDDTGEHVLIRDEHGATCEIHGSGQDSIPHFIDFLLKGREDWEREFKPRLNPDDPRRLPSGLDWERQKQGLQKRDYAVGIGIGSLYGWMRDWMGFERAAMMVYDDPGLVEEVMETITQVVLRTIEWAVPQVQIDFGAGWEDMCFINGPMISPATFEKLMVPRYKRITDALKKHGCDIIYTDCDGNINALVPLWLEGGVNGMFPVEVAPGTDPLALREEYGKEVLLLGGVNKRALAQGKEAIRKEVARIAPVVREGGWIPHVDHRVPPDVSFEDYQYYLALKRDTFGIPEPARWEERRPADWGPPK
jgi:uroporphyrinogen decarboxylase